MGSQILEAFKEVKERKTVENSVFSTPFVLCYKGAIWTCSTGMVIIHYLLYLKHLQIVQIIC